MLGDKIPDQPFPRNNRPEDFKAVMGQKVKLGMFRVLRKVGFAAAALASIVAWYWMGGPSTLSLRGLVNGRWLVAKS